MAVDDSYTKALLHCDGANASTTFTDESGKTWTAVGNAQLTTTAPKFGTACGTFDGTGDRITVPASSDFNFGTSDFTIDFWAKAGTTQMGVMSQNSASNADAGHWSFWFNVGANNIRLYVGGTSTLTGTFTQSNVWNHIALVKSSGNFIIFANGTSLGSVANSTSIGSSTIGLKIGAALNTSSTDYTGKLDEIRISKGIARWTTTFTPPTSEYVPLGGRQFQTIWWL